MAKTRYVWCSVSDSVLQEKDGNTGVTQVTYTNEPAFYGPLRSERRGSDTRQYHFDALGSTRALTDDSQTVTDTFTYDAWGAGLAGTGISVSAYGWNGRFGYHLRSDLGVLYVRSRWYSPSIGLWKSSDYDPPIIGKDLYRYSANSPISLHDPSGNEGEIPPGKPCSDVGPCAERTCWDPAMCDDCPECTCSSIELLQRIEDAEVQDWVSSLSQMKCPVIIRFGNCIPNSPGGSWTAVGKGGVGKRTVYICLSSSMQANPCLAAAILAHELSHGSDYCKSTTTPPTLPRDTEREAYGVSCRMQADQACLKKGSRERADFISQCLARGLDFSGDPALGHPCDYFDAIFGDVNDICQRPRRR